MADVFMSYAAEDRPRVRALADALKSLGWTVWWDRNLRGGTNFPKIIAAELKSARCVLVLWSVASVDSGWVSDEARVGLKREVLVTAKLDEVELPLGFGNLHATDLVGWSGDTGAPEFHQIVSDLAQLLGDPPAGKVPPGARPASAAPESVGTATWAQTPTAAQPRLWRRWIATAAGAALVVGLVAWGVVAYKADLARQEAAIAAEAARKAEEERKRVADAEAAARKAEEERKRVADAEAAARKAEEERKRVADTEAAARKAEEERKRVADAEATARKAEAERKEAERKEAERKRAEQVQTTIRLSARSLEFGTREIGASDRSGAKRLVLTSPAGTTLPFNLKFSSGPSGTAFRIVDGSCPKSPKGGMILQQTCWLAFDFQPSRAGLHTEYIEIWQGADGPSHTVRLYGTGAASGPLPPSAVGVKIASARCLDQGSGRFRIELSGRATGPYGAFLHGASNPNKGVGLGKTVCASWGASDIGDGPRNQNACKRASDQPTTTEWTSWNVYQAGPGSPPREARAHLYAIDATSGNFRMLAEDKVALNCK